MKVASFDIVFQEIPGEVTLALNLSNCPCHCPGCHSQHLAEDIGEQVTEELLDGLLARYGSMITCVAFMGGDADPVGVNQLAQYVHEEYPQYRESQGLSNGRGISCVLVNTGKGQAIWDACQDRLISMPSELEKVARHNDQLRNPSKYHQNRETILQLFEKEGYSGVERYFRTHFRKDIVKNAAVGMIPKDLKRTVKKWIGRILLSKRH